VEAIFDKRGGPEFLPRLKEKQGDSIERQRFLGEKKVRYSLGPYNEVRWDKQAVGITEGSSHRRSREP